ncbi:peptidoglycan-binding protein [Clostridium intestinale]|uniref:Uncharacterized protein n=1 Tax=Clostridium intestinale URNW TaxID=1294142 RepID=U2PYV3_9CLOT|nr:peptidoglycan-binding protein [Clostridium intestinale]ERK28964.1 hypothetical protein CINTURNW_3789 [Clostridium intestinale URNW]
MLQLGSKGQEVTDLQNKLIARGYSVGSAGADGDFGQGTYNAVVKFQTDNGLGVDGIVGPETMNAIIGSAGATILKWGSKGLLVKELQQKLISKGYNLGAAGADGDFGQATYNAVVDFQTKSSISADGIVGPMTWDALNGLLTDTLLKLGSNGDNVKKLQENLISRGYNLGPAGADGDFGPSTYNAVIQFQADHGLDRDGVVGPATWSVLNGVDNSIMLKLGSKGAAVKELQQKLIAKGYSVGAAGADGDFGQGTDSAVRKLQADFGLGVDGVVGPLTWDAINSSSFSELLKIGSKGAKVKELQSRLIVLGYNLGAAGADGDFGQATYNAVVSFQSSRGLGVDGVVGSETWNALFGTSSYELLSIGSKGESVRKLQQLLISLGYNLGAAGADGDFGQATYDAVVNFQSRNGLGVDGIVGSETWNALYGFNNGGSGVSGAAGVRKFLEVAKSQLGYRESGKNLTKYGAWYGLNGEEWCAMFISWCANEAGIMGQIVPRYAWCESGVNWYKSRGRYRLRALGYIPAPGDVVFFKNSAGEYYHTGMVESVSNGNVNTIEGNSEDMVRRNSHSLASSQIDGYGLNGGIITENEAILKEAGRVGIFKDAPVEFTAFSVETPMAIISLLPLVTVRAAVSYTPTFKIGKDFKVGVSSPTELAASAASGLVSGGIDFDFSEENIAATLQGINVGMDVGDVISYDVAIKSYDVIEITIQHKVTILGKDVYQKIIIRIQKGNLQPVYLPIIATKPDQVTQPNTKGNTVLYIIGGISFIAIALIAMALGNPQILEFFRNIFAKFIPAFGV